MINAEGAFGLRNVNSAGVDEKRLFRQKFFRHYACTRSLTGGSDDESLAQFDAAAIAQSGSAAMERRLEQARTCSSVVGLLNRRINRHCRRIEAVRQRLIEKFLRTSDDGIKAKIDRAAKLKLAYDDVTLTIFDLQGKITNMIRDGEKAISKTFSRELGERIKNVRLKRGLPRDELAKDLQISYNSLSQYERGERDVSPWTLAKISVILRTAPNELLGFTP